MPNAKHWPSFTPKKKKGNIYMNPNSTEAVMRDIEIDVILRNASALDTRKEDNSSFTTKSFYSAPLTRSWEEDRFSSMRFLDNPVRTALAGQMGTSFTAEPSMADSIEAMAIAGDLASNPSRREGQYARSPLGAAVREGLRLSETYAGRVATLQAEGAKLRPQEAQDASEEQPGAESKSGSNPTSQDLPPLPVEARRRAVRQFQALDTEGTLAVKQELIESYLSEERSILQEMGGLHSTEAGYVTLESWMAFLSSTLAAHGPYVLDCLLESLEACMDRIAETLTEGQRELGLKLFQRLDGDRCLAVPGASIEEILQGRHLQEHLEPLPVRDGVIMLEDWLRWLAVCRAQQGQLWLNALLESASVTADSLRHPLEESERQMAEEAWCLQAGDQSTVDRIAVLLTAEELGEDARSLLSSLESSSLKQLPLEEWIGSLTMLKANQGSLVFSNLLLRYRDAVQKQVNDKQAAAARKAASAEREARAVAKTVEEEKALAKDVAAALARAREESQGLRHEIEKQQKELTELVSAGEMLRSERATLLRDQASTAEQLGLLRQEAREVELEHHNAREALTLERRRLDAQRKAVEELQVPLAAVKEDVRSGRMILERARSELSDAKAECGVLEETLADTQRQTEELRHRAKVAEDELASKAEVLLQEQEALLKQLGKTQDELCSGRYLETIAGQNAVLREMTTRREGLLQRTSDGLSAGLSDSEWAAAQEVFRVADTKQEFLVQRDRLLAMSTLHEPQKSSLFSSLKAGADGRVTFSLWMDFLRGHLTADSGNTETRALDTVLKSMTPGNTSASPRSPSRRF